jgi:hypothetical protein
MIPELSMTNIARKSLAARFVAYERGFGELWTFFATGSRAVLEFLCAKTDRPSIPAPSVLEPDKGAAQVGEDPGESDRQ